MREIDLTADLPGGEQLTTAATMYEHTLKNAVFASIFEYSVMGVNDFWIESTFRLIVLLINMVFACLILSWNAGFWECW